VAVRGEIQWPPMGSFAWRKSVKELGVSDMSLSSWAREQAKNIDPKEAEQEEADRLEAIALRKRIKELEQEIEILKRFTAYWVKEGDK
jgi:transposase